MFVDVTTVYIYFASFFPLSPAWLLHLYFFIFVVLPFNTNIFILGCLTYLLFIVLQLPGATRVSTLLLMTSSIFRASLLWLLTTIMPQTNIIFMCFELDSPGLYGGPIPVPLEARQAVCLISHFYNTWSLVAVAFSFMYIVWLCSLSCSCILNFLSSALREL